MKIKDSEQDSWLKKRAEMYAALAKNDFSSTKNVEFHFADPDVGWVDMTIKFDGETVAKLPLTNAWGTDPIRGLIDIMEANIDSCEIPHYFFHDGERDEYIFHFEDIVFPSAGYRHSNGYFYSKGIFSLYIHPISYEGEDELNYVVCDSMNFIANLYTAIRDFAKRQETNERAVEEWAENAYRKYWTAMMKKRWQLERIDEAEEIKQMRAVMRKSLRSTKIERFLKEREIKK